MFYSTESTKQAKNVRLVGQRFFYKCRSCFIFLKSSCELSNAVDVMWNENEANRLEIVLIIVVCHKHESGLNKDFSGYNILIDQLFRIRGVCVQGVLLGSFCLAIAFVFIY